LVNKTVFGLRFPFDNPIIPSQIIPEQMFKLAIGIFISKNGDFIPAIVE
jgi:hypothetical protein